MNRTLRTSLVAAVAGGAMLAVPAAALGVATGSGASFPARAYQLWCQDSGLCSYTSKGSTGGITDQINGVTDWGGTDAPLTPDQLSRFSSSRGGARPLYFPTLLGAITVPVNIDGVRNIKLDGSVIADIFEGRIDNWSDRRITRSNPGVRLPSTSITRCVRQDGSGTSFGFTSYLSKVSRTFRANIGASQQPNWPSGVTVQRGPQNPGVARCVNDNRNSIGYVDIADARNFGFASKWAAVGKREVVRKRVKRGNRTRIVRRRVTRYIQPSAGATSKAANLRSFKADLTLSLTNSPATGAYPISITTWVIVPDNFARAGESASTRQDVVRMLNYFYSDAAQRRLRELQFAPLPKGLIDFIKQNQLRRIR